MKTSKPVLFSLLALFLWACNGDGKNINVDPAKIPAACAAYTACLDEEGMMWCADTLDGLGHLDTNKMSMMITMILEDGDAFAQVALALNIDCVIRAGNDCAEVFKCLNNGQPAEGCQLTQGQDEQSHCADTRNIVGCADFNGDGNTLQATIDCGALGLSCIEIVDGEETFAVCATQESQTTTQVEVTCQGDVAKAHILNLSMTMDCGFFASSCEAGTYGGIEHMDFCVGKGPDCDESTFDEYCEGDSEVTCRDGKEAGLDCSRIGRVCTTVENQTWSIQGCLFPGCSVDDYMEVCTDGSITFCGPLGSTTVSCTDLGFSACESEYGSARCVE